MHHCTKKEDVRATRAKGAVFLPMLFVSLSCLWGELIYAAEKPQPPPKSQKAAPPPPAPAPSPAPPSRREVRFIFDPSIYKRSPFQIPGAPGTAAKEAIRPRTLDEQTKDVEEAKAILMAIEDALSQEAHLGLETVTNMVLGHQEALQEIIRSSFSDDYHACHILEVSREAQRLALRLERLAQFRQSQQMLKDLKERFAKRDYEQVETLHRTLCELLAVLREEERFAPEIAKMQAEADKIAEDAYEQLLRVRIQRVIRSLDEMEGLLQSRSFAAAVERGEATLKQIEALKSPKPEVRRQVVALEARANDLVAQARAHLRRERIQKQFQALPITVNAIAYPGGAIINGQAVRVGDILPLKTERVLLVDVEETGIVLLYQDEKFYKDLKGGPVMR